MATAVNDIYSAGSGGTVYAGLLGPSSQPFRLVRGGATIGTFLRLQQCADLPWQSGDIVKVAAGSYTINAVGDVGSLYVSGGINLDTLTIEWETFGVQPVFDMSAWAAAAEAVGGDGTAFVMGPSCRNLTVRGINARGHRGGGGVGSCFVDALPGYPAVLGSGVVASLTVEYCKLQEWKNGIVTNPDYNLSVAVRYSTLQDCTGDTLSHGIYASDILLLDVLGCTFRTTVAAGNPIDSEGHLIKSRAKTTTVRGSLFDPANGCQKVIDVCNGGAFTCTGNVMLQYGAPTYGQDNQLVRFGEEQRPFFNASSPLFGNDTDNYVDDGRTHSILFAQNTVRKAQPEGGSPPFQIIDIVIPSDPSDANMTVATTIRNNIVAGPYATTFTGLYANNIEVALGTISDLGVYSGSPIAGTANDAAYAWGGEFNLPLARTDTYKGGRIVAATVPSWVPSTAWQWTSIPSTIFNNYMKNDGTGIAPTATESLPSCSASYAKQTSFGGPSYSQANHELWMFGGGHDATSLNALSKWNLGADTPSMTLLCGITNSTTRFNEQENTSAFYSDGKPKCGHQYTSNQYLDSIDEFMFIDVAAASNSSDANSRHFRATPGFVRSASAWNTTWAVRSSEGSADTGGVNGVTFADYAGANVYADRRNDGTGWLKMSAASKTFTSLGGTGIDFTNNAKFSMRHDEPTALRVGGNTPGGGWQAQFFSFAVTPPVATAVTVTGTYPSGLQVADLAWVASGGYWVGWYADNICNDSVDFVLPQKLIKFVRTSSSTITATEMTMTGTAPQGSGGNFRGMYWDAGFGCLIFVGRMDETLRAVKVS